MVCHWFDLKTTVMVSFDLASKPVVMVSPGLSLKTNSFGLVI
jgi:hypothetical protein